ncbi:MAG: hypothetical protein H7X80_04900 [bacterium]|nr:hypothetical protein [Candidatus Kapabacteria bacterium]
MRSIFLTAFIMVMAVATAAAQVPRTISFQGRARDASGVYPNNVKQVIIRILDSETGGDEIFSESHNVLFTRGAFTILIGDETPGGIPDDVHFNQELWLEITIDGFNGNSPLTPRLKFASAPSAMISEYSESAGMADALASGVTIDARFLAASDTLGSAEARNPGSLFRDNAPMAWGLIGSEGDIVSDYGISSVQHIGPGQYEIVLDNAGVMVPVPKGRNVPSYAPIVQPTLMTDSGLPIIAQWFFRPGAADQDQHISVRTFVLQNGSSGPADAAFSIVVFGRPAN